MKKQIFFVSILILASSISFSQTQKYSADIDGNGISDGITYQDYGDNKVDIIVTLKYADGTSSSPFVFANKIDRGDPNKDWGFADVNGDNRADFLTVRGVPGKLEQVTYFNKITHLDTERDYVSFIPYEGRMRIYDFPLTAKKIICTFRTNDNDKDWNSQVGMQIYYDDRVLAETFCCSSDRTGDHWSDNSDSPPINVEIKEQFTTQQLDYSLLVVSLKPDGNDEWKFDVRLRIELIDRTSRNWTFLSNDLNCYGSNRNTLSFKLSKKNRN